VLTGSPRTHNETVQELCVQKVSACMSRAHPVAEQVPVSEPREPAGDDQAVADQDVVKRQALVELCKRVQQRRVRISAHAPTGRCILAGLELLHCKYSLALFRSSSFFALAQRGHMPSTVVCGPTMRVCHQSCHEHVQHVHGKQPSWLLHGCHST
jgi:hypothetical protein